MTLPSFELSQFVRIMPPIPVPSTASAGQIIWVPDDAYSEINGTFASLHPKKSLSFLTTSLYGPKNQFLYSEYPPVRNSSLQHDRIHWFLHPIKVEKPDIHHKKPKLRIPASRWKKLTKQRKQSKLDRQAMKDIYDAFTEGEMKAECWETPVESKIVSRFSSPRTLPNGRSYYHTGVDLRARTGHEIRSTASGKVIFADHMVVPGNTIIIDHGQGVLSRYMHLSKIKVATGETIEKGAVIGLAGATGRVEAAHLHWEIVWKGHKANPFLFMEEWNRHCSNDTQPEIENSTI